MDIEKMMKTVDTNPMSSTFWEKVCVRGFPQSRLQT